MKMNFSYWERQSWLDNIDYTVVGSGITGLNCALHLKKRFPRSKVLVLERGLLPNGASTRNAGFACFGSLSEILDDLRSHPEEQVLELIRKRITGLQMLRENLGDSNIGFRSCGGYELFRHEDSSLYEECFSKRGRINRLLQTVIGNDVFEIRRNSFGFGGIREEIAYNRFEGQLDTGRMMTALLNKVHAVGINVLNNIKVEGFSDGYDSVEVETDKLSVRTGKLFIATNGFASQFGIPDVKPARAQVLITRPIRNLHIKGTFHLEKGFYYFRNVNDRILFGGGRNLDFRTEETIEFGETELIQNKLEEMLREIILPETPFEIEHRWSGIMGVGDQKGPLVTQLSGNVFCGVRLGGMGIAIGSLLGKELAELI